MCLLLGGIFVYRFSPSARGQILSGVLFSLAFLCVAGVGLAALKNRSKDWFYSGMLIVGLILSSWLSRLHTGGWDNVLMPAFACLAIFFGLGIHQFQSCLGARKQIWMGQVFLILCVFQLSFVFYPPAGHIPSRADVEAGRQVIRKIQSLPGDVYLPSHGYLLTMGGKPPLAHAQATADVFRSHERELSRELAGEIRTALRNRTFGALVFDIPRHYVENGTRTPWVDELFLVDETRWLLDEVSVSYEPSGILFPEESAFWPVTGLKTRPQQIYRIKK